MKHPLAPHERVLFTPTREEKHMFEPPATRMIELDAVSDASLLVGILLLSTVGLVLRRLQSVFDDHCSTGAVTSE